MYTKIIRFDALAAWRNYHRLIGNRVVATNGCFDILHRGHVDNLNRARQMGDILIVGLNSDESANDLKKFYPVNSQEDRAFVMAGLEAVSFVVIFEGVTANTFLDAVEPTTWVKGGDYSEATVDQEELAIVKKHGGSLAIVPLIQGYSTGRTIRKMEKNPDYAKAQAPDVLPGDVSRRDEAHSSAGDSTVQDPSEDAGSVLRATESLRPECRVPQGGAVPGVATRT